MRVHTRKRLAPSIETFPGGVRIIGLRGHGKGNENPPKRGDIKGWSKDSRKRMRDFLLTHQPAPGLKSYGVTLTVPGPSIEPEQARRLWNHFAKHFLTRNGCGAVWRLEIQKRGAAHWHCLLAAPQKIDGEFLATVLRRWWLLAIDNLSPWYCHAGGDLPEPEKIAQGCQRHRTEAQWWDVSRVPCKTNRKLPSSMAHLQDAADWLQQRKILFGHGVVTVMNRDELEKCSFSKWPGAWKFSVHLQDGGGKGAWLRYLQDHATKAKQDQIAEGFGRHWGVVGRSYFVELQPEGEKVFSCRESYFRFWRAYHRLTRPVMSYRIRREMTGEKFSKRPFGGKSLGWSSSRGIYGNSVWYSKPETVLRILDWSESSLRV